jgi:hypothetical protein
MGEASYARARNSPDLTQVRYAAVKRRSSPPFEPALTIAQNTAARLKQLGEQLFDQVFNSTADLRRLWSMAEGQLENTRIEIAGDPSRSTAPWEILWNPLDVRPVACRAASFVRAGY